jgi:hypothetical protein
MLILMSISDWINAFTEQNHNIRSYQNLQNIAIKLEWFAHSRHGNFNR